jgi:serine/threonine protein phosphatase PrpC
MKLKSYSAHTHQGPHLQINEDDVEIDLINQLYIIFDGFGGSAVGDKAVREIKQTIKNFYTKIGGDPDATLPFYFSQKYLIEGNALVNAMVYAHEELKNKNTETEMNERGGASCIAVAQSENILTIVGTGNCAGFLYRNGHISQVMAPDNMEFLGQDEYLKHFLSMPMSGFGLFDDLHFKVSEVRIKEEDVLILLTDGVYSRLSPEEIKFTIERKRPSDGQKVKELFKLANSRGNMDNQSTILLQY